MKITNTKITIERFRESITIRASIRCPHCGGKFETGPATAKEHASDREPNLLVQFNEDRNSVGPIKSRE